MTASITPATTIRVAYENLLDLTTAVFAGHGLPEPRAAAAAAALCHGDLTGVGSHGLANLTRLYLPLLEESRVDPAAEPEITRDLGPCVVVDAHRALGLWAAGVAMDLAVERARAHGIGLASVRLLTHIGCAGYHAARAAHHGTVGLVASNCGGQRIARPPGGRLAMLGTNPLSVAAPVPGGPPFVLDMSTTVVPTGRVREAARAGREVPPGWLAADDGSPVTDPATFDRGEAHLRWLGGAPETGAYKGFGLGVTVEVLAALLSGAGFGPAREALLGDGRPSGRDDDIGLFMLAIDPGLLRPDGGFQRDADELFSTLLACPSTEDGRPVRYPGWPEAERARRYHRDGVPLSGALFDELCAVAGAAGLPALEEVA
ncbi:Ldh family oxidoreductase [Actinophytocola sp.]|uniref:Ldh family oxidoreductase n=1 Tax=Actinophytocola sp. TaxID=1872138 RepID=UPI003D6AE297